MKIYQWELCVMENLCLIGFEEEKLYVRWQKCNGIHLMHSFLEAIIISLKDQIRGIIKKKEKTGSSSMRRRS